MRPAQLNPLFASVLDLKSVGPKRAKTIGKAVLGPTSRETPRVLDLLLHLPQGTVDRRRRPRIAEAVVGETATIEVHIDGHDAPRTTARPYRIHCHDETGDIVLVFFKADKRYLQNLLPPGARRYVSGRVDEFNGMLQIVHPDHVVDEEGLSRLPMVEPVYGLSAGLSGKMLAAAMREALQRLPELEEWLDPELVRQRRWPSFAGALRAVHQPELPEAVLPSAPAGERLAYDELLSGQLALALVRAQFKRARGRAIKVTGELTARIRAALPFALTGSQETAIKEIAGDLGEPLRMLRLLQGDVGSGKTVVALLAMAGVAEAGLQSALMAPTEILARQHYATIAPLAEAAGLRAELLTGREKGKARAAILEALKSGDIDILVGTHALIQEDVAFADLAFAVVDEQHRFGVQQRLALTGKSPQGVDLLVMTATPIPRTLVLSYFGDMDVSRLAEKPAGRKPVATRVIPAERLDEIVEGLARALAQGARVYWVCPLVEESENSDLTPAEERFRHLKTIFGDAAVLVHGRMSGRDKDAAMAAFSSGAARILVATTVIEVGVDVPEANIIVIEHAERFGLAQLHQLRGRVGRGEAVSSCILLYKGPLSENARARLTILRETDDGFHIAEEDLRLRGEGEVLGTRQSGMPGFRIARPELHAGLLETARQDARAVLERDPGLASPRGKALRTLLYVFERDEAVRLLGAG